MFLLFRYFFNGIIAFDKNHAKDTFVKLNHGSKIGILSY